MNKLLRVGTMFRELGIRGTYRYLFVGRLLELKRVFFGGGVEHPSYLLTSKTCSAPLICRLGTSDRIVFAQVFIDKQYATTASLEKADWIIDCGANVGYASAFFLSRFPDSKVVAIEPEGGNYKQACANLATFGSRVTVIQSGIWSGKSGLKVCVKPHKDGQEWAFEVRECDESEDADVQGIDIDSILESSKFDRIDILKMDIEGSEKQVFSHNVEGWIRKVKQFQVELHDDECRNAFHRALSGSDYDFTETGEITIATRR